MDIFLHFFVSLGLSTLLLLALSNRGMSRSPTASRFWGSSDRLRSMIYTTAILLSVLGALGFGIIKEWIDGLGYGDVELTDFLANLAGIWVGTWLVLHRIRKESTRRRIVRYSFNTVNKNRDPHEYLKLKILQARQSTDSDSAEKNDSRSPQRPTDHS